MTTQIAACVDAVPADAVALSGISCPSGTQAVLLNGHILSETEYVGYSQQITLDSAISQSYFLYGLSVPLLGLVLGLLLGAILRLMK